MLRMQIIGLAIVSALLMSAVVASIASAETELHQWLLVHHLSGGGLEHLLLASPLLVHSLGLLLLTDKNPTGGRVTVHCHGFDHGTVGPHGLDLVLAITTELLKGSNAIPCTFDPTFTGGCKSNATPKALAVNLPWLTHILLDRTTEIRDRILGDGNGRPGWRVVCTNILGGESIDECIGEEPGGGPLLNNVAEGVESKFDNLSGDAECKLTTEGTFRKEAGEVRGSTIFFNPSATLLLRISFGP